MSAAVMLKSVALFVIAGFCEIAGGYLVWLWLRHGRGAVLGAAGGLTLFLYGVVPTFQPAHVGWVYAAYGGFLSFSRFCGDGVSMEAFATDSIGSARAFASWASPPYMYAPRS